MSEGEGRGRRVRSAVIGGVGWLFAAIGAVVAALLSLVAIGSIVSLLNPGNVIVQDGQQDILGSAKLSVLLLGPVWVLAHLPLIGGVACSSGDMGFLATVLVGGLQLVALVFVLKGMLLAMWELSTGAPELGSPIASIGAGILPIVVASLVTIEGTSLLTCLFP